MKGKTEIKYTANGQVKYDYTVEDTIWGEDNLSEGPYEHPAEPGEFPIYLSKSGKYKIGIRHPESGIKVHGSRWSEGCPNLGNGPERDAILSDIESKLTSGKGVIAILEVTDNRSEEEKSARPLPYE